MSGYICGENARTGNKKKCAQEGNMAAAVCTAVLGTAYVYLKKKDKPKALVCKALATFMPALLLLRAFPDVGQGKIPPPLFGWTLAALVFYIAADVLLECRFVAGAVTFSLGHLCMTAGFLTGGELRWADGKESGEAVCLAAGGVLLSLMLVAAAWFVLRKYIPHLKAKKLFRPALMYVSILSAMAALAILAGICTSGTEGLLTASGGISFVISDILLGMNRLGRKRSGRRGAAVLILYYLSVYFLSVRVWI